MPVLAALLAMIGVSASDSPALAYSIVNESVVLNVGDLSENFGRSVTIDGTTVLVGAIGESTYGSTAGAVYVFENDASGWNQQAKLFASDAGPNQWFGISVDVDDDLAVVGANQLGNYWGSAYVFRRTGTTWTEEARLFEPAVGFGYTVAVDGSTVLIGALNDYGATSDSGSAYVYVDTPGGWTLQQKLTASDGGTGDAFGYDVSVSGDTALVGATGDDDNGSSSGSAYVFQRTGTAWIQQEKLTASDADNSDRFGFSVAIDGDVALVSAPFNDARGGVSDSGSAYVFDRVGASWSETARLAPPDPVQFGHFGWPVDLDGNKAVVSAENDDHGGQPSTGSGYLFQSSGGIWTLESKLIASDVGPWQSLGHDAAISGDIALLSALGLGGRGVYMFTPPEVCDGLDNDFDGLIDEGFVDTDGDGIADCVDTDDDNDGVLDVDDAFPLDDSEWLDTDGDGIGDNGDNCDDVSNVDQADNDLDGFGDVCDTDDDNDGVSDEDEIAAGSDPLNKLSTPEVCGDDEDNDLDGVINEGCNEDPDCSAAVASILSLWPNNGNFYGVTVLGVTDPDGDVVTITIDSIYQDEPVYGPSSGNTSPDGVIDGSSAELRAERDGSGNGRVYYIGFTADDGNGGSCSGVVEVGVPHDQGSGNGSGGPAVGDGPLFDSLSAEP